VRAPWRTALAAAALSLLAGCGLQPASQAVPDVEAGPELAEFEDLAGAPIVTTSKDFTEQLILGRMLSLVLTAKGAEVSDQTNAKGSANARESIVSEATDIQWEYTGTAWVSYMGHADGDPGPNGEPVTLSKAEQVYQAVKATDEAENNIFWADPAPFNNTFALAVTKADSKKYGLATLSDLADLPTQQQTFCMETEFAARGDGWPGVQKTYDLDVSRDAVTIMDPGIIFSRIGGSCLVGLVNDTDGRIINNDLVTLDDDRGFFPIYEPAVNIRNEVLKPNPQIADMFEKVGSRLSTDTMRELNARVDVAGEDPLDVAQDWLTTEGFLAPA
jgi:osmoprotectant transport system substrate-binding protein